MSFTVLSRSYAEPPLCRREILRYAGCRDGVGEIADLADSCIAEARDAVTYKVCFSVLPVDLRDGVCDLGGILLHSDKLRANLAGCGNAVVFAATLGVGIDRLIAKYGRLSPARALMLQAIGAERIEALCDAFCRDVSEEYGTALHPRFSPGYGDLSIECQKPLFALLDCGRRIGLTLTDSLLMSPSKSVTAIVGMGDGGIISDKCSTCNAGDCSFRGKL